MMQHASAAYNCKERDEESRRYLIITPVRCFDALVFRQNIDDATTAFTLSY